VLSRYLATNRHTRAKAADGKDLSSVKLSNDFHRCLGECCEAVRSVGRNDHHVPGRASPPLTADRDVDLTGQDPQNLLAVVEVHGPTFLSA
jgi:hypothetical protein